LGDHPTATIHSVSAGSVAIHQAFVVERLQVAESCLSAATKLKFNVLCDDAIPPSHPRQNPISAIQLVALIEDIRDMRIRDIRDTIRDIDSQLPARLSLICRGSGTVRKVDT